MGIRLTESEIRIIDLYAKMQGNLAGSALYRAIAMRLNMKVDKNNSNTYVERVVDKYLSMV